MSTYTLLHGDAREQLVSLPDNSVDSIVTDPPYELGFMGKSWDSTGVAFNSDVWREALRVLKPGGHLLSFSGSRTYHRMVVAIEDAGFEIRDQIMWVYGSGFPKSLDVSKAIDKAAGVEGLREFKCKNPADRPYTHVSGETSTGWQSPVRPDKTNPYSDAAKQWAGWGTALKPAHEPVVVARKPLIGTVAANVLEHGTGALNIDACRVLGGSQPSACVGTGWAAQDAKNAEHGFRPKAYYEGQEGVDYQPSALGRWPANLIHDGSDEVLAAFPDAKGQQGALTGEEPSSKTGDVYGLFDHRAPSTPRTDNSTSAARYFYCAKASKKDRGEGNNHPTVKPTELMRYLVRLVTPPNGIVLDPFMGSGSTGKAALLEGFRFIGIDRTAEYIAIADNRIAALASAAVGEHDVS